MILLKHFLIILIFVLFSIFKLSNQEVQTIYIRSVQCNFSNQFVYQNVSCFPKSYNRSFSTINIITKFKAPMTKMFVSYSIVLWTILLILGFFKLELKLFFKYGTIYREVIYMRRIDWCETMRNHTDNKILLQLLNLLKDSAPGLLHECPYTVRKAFYLKAI